MPSCLKKFLIMLTVLFLFFMTGLSAFFWRLSKTPLDVNAYIPRIVSFLTPPNSGITFSVSSAFLKWGGFKYPLELFVQNVQVRYQDGKTLFAVPEMSLSFWLRSLVVGHVIPRSMTIVRPYLRLKVNKQGELYLSDENHEEKEGEESKKSSFSPEFMSHIAHWQNDISRFFLRDAHVVIDDAFHGVKWNISPINLLYNQSFFKYEIDGNMTIDTAGAPLTIRVDGDWKHPSDVSLNLSVKDLNLQSFRLSERHPALKGIKAPISVESLLSLNMRPFLRGEKKWHRETLEKIALKIKIGQGVVEIPAPVSAKYDIKKAFANALWYDAGDKFDIKSFQVVMSEANVNGHIEVSGLAQAIDKSSWVPIKSKMTANVNNMPLDKLKYYWPGGISSDVHSWVTTNITVGQAVQGRFVLDFKGLKEGGIDCSYVDGTLRLRHAKVRYLDELPDVDDVDGLLKFSLNDIKGVLTAGHTFGVSIQKGTIDFLDLQSDKPFMDLNLDLDGNVKDVIRILDYPYLSFFKGTGIAPRNAEGKITGSFGLKIPLGDAFKGPEQIEVKTQANIRNGSLTNVYGGLDFSDINAQVGIAEKELTLKGSGLLYSSPVSFNLSQSFKDNADVLTRLYAKGVINNDSRSILDKGSKILTPPVLDGLLNTELSFFYYPNSNATLDIDMNLSNMEVNAWQMGWKKSAPHPAFGKFHLDMNKGVALSGATFSVKDDKGNGINGLLDFNKKGDLTRINADLKAEKTDAKAVFVFEKEKNKAVFSGKMLDFRGLLNQEKLKQDDDELPVKVVSSSQTSVGKQMHINGAVDKIWLKKDGASDTSFSAVYNGKHWTNIHVNSKVGTDLIPVDFNMTPNQQGEYDFLLKSPDAGETLRVLDIISTVKGGEVSIKGVYSPKGNKTTGTLSVSKFYVSDMPVFTRILSLSGIIDTVKGDGLQFDKSEVPFVFDDNVLTISSGIVSGPSIGVTFNGQYFKETDYLNFRGSLVPFYSINSLLGKIPLIGTLFSGAKGGGLIAPTFTVRGKMPNPQISVNALSALAPGAIGRLVGFWTDKKGDLSKKEEKTVLRPKKKIISDRREVLSSATLEKKENEQKSDREIKEESIKRENNIQSRYRKLSEETAK